MSIYDKMFKDVFEKQAWPSARLLRRGKPVTPVKPNVWTRFYNWLLGTKRAPKSGEPGYVQPPRPKPGAPIAEIRAWEASPEGKKYLKSIEAKADAVSARQRTEDSAVEGAQYQAHNPEGAATVTNPVEVSPAEKGLSTARERKRGLNKSKNQGPKEPYTTEQSLNDVPCNSYIGELSSEELLAMRRLQGATPLGASVSTGRSSSIPLIPWFLRTSSHKLTNNMIQAMSATAHKQRGELVRALRQEQAIVGKGVETAATKAYKQEIARLDLAVSMASERVPGKVKTVYEQNADVTMATWKAKQEAKISGNSTGVKDTNGVETGIDSPRGTPRVVQEPVDSAPVASKPGSVLSLESRTGHYNFPIRLNNGRWEFTPTFLAAIKDQSRSGFRKAVNVFDNSGELVRRLGLFTAGTGLVEGARAINDQLPESWQKYTTVPINAADAAVGVTNPLISLTGNPWANAAKLLGSTALSNTVRNAVTGSSKTLWNTADGGIGPLGTGWFGEYWQELGGNKNPALTSTINAAGSRWPTATGAIIGGVTALKRYKPGVYADVIKSIDTHTPDTIKKLVAPEPTPTEPTPTEPTAENTQGSSLLNQINRLRQEYGSSSK